MAAATHGTTEHLVETAMGWARGIYANMTGEEAAVVQKPAELTVGKKVMEGSRSIELLKEKKLKRIRIFLFEIS